MLTLAKIKKANPKDRPYKVFDQRGLYLLVNPTGSKLWRFKYRYQGKEKLLALGMWPEVGLEDARRMHQRARDQLRAGIDPMTQRAALRHPKPDHFSTVAEEWRNTHRDRWSPSHAARTERILDKDLLPWLKDRPIGAITAPELLQVLRRIEARGAIETAHRARRIAAQIFKHAIATGRASWNPANDLQGILKPKPRTRHHPAITDPRELGGLLRAIDGYRGDPITRLALQLLPHTLVRPGELRRANWDEFNLEAAEWRIPAHRMKQRRPHIVPLSRQAVAILKELRPLTEGHPFAFPGMRSPSRPISENTLTGALRRLGYSADRATAHGFRSTGSTLLHEQGWPHTWIERQLAHMERSTVAAAYNHSEYLAQRRIMLQWWSDYLDALRAGEPPPPKPGTEIGPG